MGNSLIISICFLFLRDNHRRRCWRWIHFKNHKCKVQWGSNPQLQNIIIQNKENISIIQIAMQPVKMENIKTVNGTNSGRTWITKSLMCNKITFSYQLKWKWISPIVILVLCVNWLAIAIAALKKQTTPSPSQRQKQTEKPKLANLNNQNKKPRSQPNLPQKSVLAWSHKIESSFMIRNTALTFDYSFFCFIVCIEDT